MLKIESRILKKKIRPTEADLNPNLMFINNELIQILESSKELRRYSEARKVNWIGDENQEMFRKMFIQIKDSETYIEYINSEAKGFEEDKSFSMELFKMEIANSEILYNFFEEKVFIGWTILI